MDEFDVQVASIVGRFAWPGAGVPKPTQRLLDLGIDSMSVITLALTLEAELGIVFPESLFTAEVFETCATLAAAMRRLRVEAGPMCSPG